MTDILNEKEKRKDIYSSFCEILDISGKDPKIAIKRYEKSLFTDALGIFTYEEIYNIISSLLRINFKGRMIQLFEGNSNGRETLRNFTIPIFSKNSTLKLFDWLEDIYGDSKLTYSEYFNQVGIGYVPGMQILSILFLYVLKKNNRNLDLHQILDLDENDSYIFQSASTRVRNNQLALDSLILFAGSFPQINEIVDLLLVEDMYESLLKNFGNEYPKCLELKIVGDLFFILQNRKPDMGVYTNPYGKNDELKFDIDFRTFMRKLLVPYYEYLRTNNVNQFINYISNSLPEVLDIFRYEMEFVAEKQYGFINDCVKTYFQVTDIEENDWRLAVLFSNILNVKVQFHRVSITDKVSFCMEYYNSLKKDRSILTKDLGNFISERTKAEIRGEILISMIINWPELARKHGLEIEAKSVTGGLIVNLRQPIIGLMKKFISHEDLQKYFLVSIKKDTTAKQVVERINRSSINEL